MSEWNDASKVIEELAAKTGVDIRRSDRKTYTFRTDDPLQAERWFKADAMCQVLWDFDEELRRDAKYCDNRDNGQYWRDMLRDAMVDEGIDLERIWS